MPEVSPDQVFRVANTLALLGWLGLGTGIVLRWHRLRTLLAVVGRLGTLPRLRPVHRHLDRRRCRRDPGAALDFDHRTARGFSVRAGGIPAVVSAQGIDPVTMAHAETDSVMTTAVQAYAPTAVSRASWFERATPGQALLIGAALFLLLAMLPTFLTMAIEVRTLNGINVWIKPAKFEFSVAVQFLTVAWFLQLLPPEQRASRLATGLCQTMAAVGILEIAYIALQASKGEASHFNSSTPLSLALYSLMGIGAITMLSISGWLGIMILRHGDSSKPFVSITGLSLIVGSLLGALTGIFMSMHHGHWVGGLHTDVGGLPTFGWSRSGGDLRVAPIHRAGLKVSRTKHLQTLRSNQTRCWKARSDYGNSRRRLATSVARR